MGIRQRENQLHPDDALHYPAVNIEGKGAFSASDLNDGLVEAPGQIRARSVDLNH